VKARDGERRGGERKTEEGKGSVNNISEATNESEAGI